ncbi:MAG: hypothetical protein JSR21_13320 [Proteobacteria bacterium]|nr:hypothetical protein [Pseudomonadota bacterium]
MVIEPAVVGPASMFLGAVVGGSASLLAAILTHRFQYRSQGIASEVAKREAVYADFVMSASNILLRALTHDEIVIGGDEQRLLGLINRMRLFAPDQVVAGADAVLRAILEIALQPSVELRQLTRDALSRRIDPDPLLTFSEICRADLDRVRRTGT